MTPLICKGCGSSLPIPTGDYTTCKYCGISYQVELRNSVYYITNNVSVGAVAPTENEEKQIPIEPVAYKYFSPSHPRLQLIGIGFIGLVGLLCMVSVVGSLI